MNDLNDIGAENNEKRNMDTAGVNQDQCKWIEVVNSIPVYLITTTHLIGILLIQFEQLESILLFGKSVWTLP